ncbi:TetR/AcrR family transcriptional regulator [Iodobacter sp. LRB]|uniref:TetR/AcrR family transcriptional regulator n=1 Tax=unclassified Iodobacter TaxID=235634 RepID=UPI000C109816|nr:TetR/AcrR family transcriptional regulator [Iodobacter sp. BJB302]PHV03536.1 TetR family transcriptional regulator [Iodobacter sp. BJB302]
MVESVKAQDTANRILDAAEPLFVEHGFDATSMRMITQSARVNIAAVNYYYHSKDGLFRAVFERRAEPFARLLLGKLEELEKSVAKPTADQVAEAFVMASLEMGRNPEYGGLLFVRLVARTFVEPHPELKATMPQRYGELTRRYLAALGRALPHLSELEVQWRFHFLSSAMFNAFAGNNVLRLFTESSLVNARDPALVVRMLMPFISAGLNAPASQ